MHNITPHWPGVATGASSEDLETLGNRNFAKISRIKFKTDMNSTTENTNSQNKTTKKVWTTSKHDSVKNYQPDAVLTATIDKRRRNYEVQCKNALISEGALRAEANQKQEKITQALGRVDLEEMKKKKEDNRKGYQRRLDSYKDKNREEFSLLSPKCKLGLNEKIRLWSRYHRCGCTIDVTDPKTLVTSKVPLKHNSYRDSQFSCVHVGAKRVKDSDGSLGHTCQMCGSRKLLAYRAACGCMYFLCRSCRISNFSYYDGNEQCVQFYDWHIDNECTTHLTVVTESGVEEKKGTDFRAFLKRNVITRTAKTHPQSVKGVSYAAAAAAKPIMTDNEEVIDDYICYRLSDNLKAIKQLLAQAQDTECGKTVVLKYIPTIPEGSVIGSMNNVADKTQLIFGQIKDKIKAFIEDIKVKVSRIITNHILSSIPSIVRETLVSFLDTFSYFIKYILHILCYIDPVEIVSLFYSRGPLESITRFATVFARLQKEVEISRLKMQALLVREDWFKQVKSGKSDFGILNFLVRETLRDLPYGEWYQVLLHPECFSVTGYDPSVKVDFVPSSIACRYSLGLIQTKPESGISHLFDFFSSIISSAPSRLTRGVSMLSNLLIQLKPHFSAFKVAADSAKIIKTIISSIVSVIFGTFKDTREWLQHCIVTPGNPIHDMTTAFIAYQNVVFMKTPSLDTPDASDIRDAFYTSKALVEDFVMREKRFSSIHLDYVKKLTEGMNTPPAATARTREPTCLVLSGPAGVGKSTMWKSIVGGELFSEQFLREKDPVEEIEKVTHTWNSSSDFQPGMSNKRVIVFDDFQQRREDQEEALAMIHLCSTAPFPINSPNITGVEIKGMFASPEIIVACTNVDVSQAAQGLASTEALHRRYHLELQMCAPYCKEDPRKKIFIVKSCVLYKDLIGVECDLASAKLLFAVIHRVKAEQFVSTRTMVTEEIRKELSKTILEPLSVATITPQGSAWQKSGDFFRDAKRVLTIPESSSKLSDFLKLTSDLIAHGVRVGTPLVMAFSFLSAFARIEHIVGRFMVGSVSVTQFCKELIRPFIGFLVTTGLAISAYYSLVTPSESESGQTRTAKRRTRTYDDVVETYPEASQDVFASVIRSSTGSVKMHHNGMGVNCVFVGGHYVLIPKHFFQEPSMKYVSEGRVFSITKHGWSGAAREVKFESARLKPIQGNIYKGFSEGNLREDVVLYELDKRFFQAEKNITRHFWDGSYSLKNRVVHKYDFYGWEKSPFFEVSTGTVTRDMVHTDRVEDNTVVFHVVGLATFQSRPASCGSLVRLEGQDSPLVGVHIARTTDGQAAFHYVTRSSLVKAMSSSGVRDVEQSFITTQQEGAEYLPEGSILEFVGQVDKNVHQPTKTDLEPSEVFEFYGPHITEPAVMSGRDPRLSEEYVGPKFFKQLFRGYTKREGEFSSEDLNLAFESMKDTMSYISSKSIVKHKLLGVDEILNTPKYIPDSSRMLMGTSAGWPYITKGQSKKDLFTVEENDDIIPGDGILSEYFEAEDKIQHGVVPFLPFALMLKDERVKLSKIEIPKTRIFACSNVIHFMIMRKYFYARMMQIYHADFRDSFCMPKMNRFSIDWHEFSQFMLEVGKRGFDFDFQFWDRSLQKVMIWMATEILLEGLSISERERDTLCELNSSPFMIFGKDVLRSTGVLMSGSLLTYTLNCVVNELIHRSAYIHVMKSRAPYLSSIRDYLQFTRGMRGGDDTISVVDDRILEFYNGKTVGEFFLSRGLGVTATDKSANLEEKKDYLSLSFLKCQTQYRQGYFLPLPEVGSLIESMYWIRYNKFNADRTKATQDNVICALRGLYFHGETLYSEVRRRALVAQPALILPHYEELHTMWQSYACFPGSHADFATRELQEDPFISTPKLHQWREDQI